MSSEYMVALLPRGRHGAAVDGIGAGISTRVIFPRRVVVATVQPREAHVYGKRPARATLRVILKFRAAVEPPEARPWETFTAMAFNPRIPTLAEAMAEALTPAETTRFAAHLRPLVERGEGAFPMALAYLWATKR